MKAIAIVNRYHRVVNFAGRDMVFDVTLRERAEHIAWLFNLQQANAPFAVRDVDPRCMTCGHAPEAHVTVRTTVAGPENACEYHDAEGPCACTQYVPCDHVPRSISTQGKVCVCGLTCVSS